MLRHNLLLIYRNFKRFKTTFIINIVGLSVAMASALLIWLWMVDEWSFDRYHVKNSRLFQVMEKFTFDNGIEITGHTQPFLAEVLMSEVPEIEYAVTVTPPFFFPAFTLTADSIHASGVGKYVDKDFLDLFSYELVEGNRKGILSDKNSVLLSERVARNLFPGSRSVVGKSLDYQIFTLTRSVTVTGVFKEVPRNSSEQFDFIFPFDAFRDIMGWKNKTLDWEGKAPFFTYVTLREGTDIPTFAEKFSGYLGAKTPNAANRLLFLKPFSDSYLYGRYEDGVATGRIEYVKLFGIIACFILIIACVNFMNLSTARAGRRFIEIGIHKAIGADRRTLICQHLGESILMSLLALAIALLIVDILLPQFNLITGKSLSLNFDRHVVMSSVLIALATGLFAGSYPAFFLSGLNTVKVLQGKFRASGGALWVRRGLAVFQFALSVIFIVGVLVVHKQIQFVQTKNLGYDRDNVMYFGSSGRLAGNPETFLNELRKIPGVVNASSMLGNIISGPSDTPGGGMPGTHSWKGKDVVMNVSQVNYDLIETLGIEIKSGRSFSRFRGGTDGRQYIYNEAAIEALGIDNPVGTLLPDGGEIVGVAKDFHFQSLHESIQPHCFMLAPEAASTILVKIQNAGTSQTIGAIGNLYKAFNAGFEFRYKFLDDNYQALYASERKVEILSGYFAALTIVISCLGVFGLAAFTAERRTKEIGIRKVLGSNVFGIVYLLSIEFSKIVLISIIIAIPISYVLADRWLQSFAYRVDVEWWLFAGSALAAFVIVWLTVGAQAFRAARLNPVSCLRDE